MKITFAGLKTTGKVDTVWAVMNLERSSEQHYYPPWTIFRYTDYIIVWGRRGGKLRSLRINDEFHFEIPCDFFDDPLSIPARSDSIGDFAFLRSLVGGVTFGDISVRILEKLRNGYVPVKADNLSDVYPEFEHDLGKINFWEQLRT